MTNPTAAELIARSNRLGSDPRVTNYAGGNTSAKGTDIDPVTGKPIELLWVKGSGGDLGTLTEPGLAILRLDRLRTLTNTYPGVERETTIACCNRPFPSAATNSAQSTLTTSGSSRDGSTTDPGRA
jgi:rhamnose utilization protein RhaD (predicted bifunctional aldolase and dehydrogenase)